MQPHRPFPNRMPSRASTRLSEPSLGRAVGTPRRLLALLVFVSLPLWGCGGGSAEGDGAGGGTEAAQEAGGDASGGGDVAGAEGSPTDGRDGTGESAEEGPEGAVMGGEVITRTAVDTTAWIVPGSRVGPVRAGMTRADLVAEFGAQAITEGVWEMEEGMCLPSITLFPGTARALDMVFVEGEGTPVSTVRIDEPGAPWVLGIGLGIGTSLEEVERLNGKAFVFSGFGWEYGGWIRSWLDGAIGARIDDVEIRLALGDGAMRALSAEQRDEILGEEPVMSNNEAVPGGSVTVDRIDVLLGESPRAELQACPR